MAEVTDIDPEHRRVYTHDRSFTYDYLVIATGARHSYFGHEEWASAAPGLKTIDDATSIRARILLAFEQAEMELNPEIQKEFLTFVIVGAGPTGVEMAGAIAELAHRALATDFKHIDPDSTRIVLIEAGPRILASFPEDLSEKAARSLKNLGVEIWCHSKVEHVDHEGALVSGKKLRARTVIWAAGVIASPAGEWLKVPAGPVGRIEVREDLTVPGYNNIFAIGDVAKFPTPDDRGLPGVAPVAIQQGEFVGRQISKLVRGQIPDPRFVYFNKGNLATIGRSSAIAHIGKLKLSGFIAWLLWSFVHIMYLIGFRNRILVMIQWFWAYLTFQRGARLITHEWTISHSKSKDSSLAAIGRSPSELQNQEARRV